MEEKTKEIEIITDKGEKRVLKFGKIKMKHKMEALRESLTTKTEGGRELTYSDPYKSQVLQCLYAIKEGKLSFEEYLELDPKYGDLIADAFMEVMGDKRLMGSN